jgi:DNA-binding PadR family transcriptional regulator
VKRNDEGRQGLIEKSLNKHQDLACAIFMLAEKGKRWIKNWRQRAQLRSPFLCFYEDLFCEEGNNNARRHLKARFFLVENLMS